MKPAECYDIRSMGSIRKRSHISACSSTAASPQVSTCTPTCSSVVSGCTCRCMPDSVSTSLCMSDTVAHSGYDSTVQTCIADCNDCSDQLSNSSSSSPSENKRQKWKFVDSISSMNPISCSHNAPVCTVSAPCMVSDTDYSACDRCSESLYSNCISKSLPEQLLDIELRLAARLLSVDFSSKVSHVYNPLEYAIKPHVQFLQKYCCGLKEILFLGMNPGPFGMAQTGVPFGDVKLVRDWLRIHADVDKPVHQHPLKLVQGFACTRSEVSGTRFWTLFQQISTSPDVFFRSCFVHNLCPLLFLSPKGKNLTPSDLPVATRRHIDAACEESLVEVIGLLKVKKIVGVGKYAHDHAVASVRSCSLTKDVDVVSIMHPSPANPAANKGWHEIATKQLTDHGLLIYLQ